MNLITLFGRLVDDPVLGESRNKKVAEAKFKLAVNNSKEDTMFVQIYCYNKTAELAAKHLSKGSELIVNGSLAIDNWKDEKSGEWKTFVKVIANRLGFTSGSWRKESESSMQRTVEQGQLKFDTKIKPSQEFTSDDIPF